MRLYQLTLATSPLLFTLIPTASPAQAPSTSPASPSTSQTSQPNPVPTIHAEAVFGKS